MRFYLDASVMLPVLVSEAGSDAVDAFMTSCSGLLVVSDLAATEVASALSGLVRTGKVAATAAEGRLSDFDSWRGTATENIDLQASDVRLASVFVRRFDLRLHGAEALHAAICRRSGDTLVTLDPRLAEAATELGIAVAVPGS